MIRFHVWLSLLFCSIVVALTLDFLAVAAAKDAPRLIASNVEGEMRQCGDTALIAGVEQSDGPVWINYVDGRMIQLRDALPTRRDIAMSFLACSPDGWWVIYRYERSGAAEGEGDPTCRTMARDFPVVILWDTLKAQHRVIGKGFFSFSFSPDGSKLVYFRDMLCNFDRDRRTSIDLSSLRPTLTTIPASQVLKDLVADPRGRGLGMAEIAWVGPDRFIAHLAAKQGDVNAGPSGGAVVAVTKAATAEASTVQLNPTAFGQGAMLNIQQIRPAESDRLLGLAHCTAFDNQSIGCETDRKISGRRGVIDPGPYCKDERPGHAIEFCRKLPEPIARTRYRIGSHTLIGRSNGRNGEDLFLVDE